MYIFREDGRVDLLSLLHIVRILKGVIELPGQSVELCISEVRLRLRAFESSSCRCTLVTLED